MYVKSYIRDIEEFEFWSGAKNIIDTIKECDKLDELTNLCNAVFNCDDENNAVDETTLNDFLWHDWEYIFGELGIDENGNNIEDEDEDEDEECEDDE